MCHWNYFRLPVPALVKARLARLPGRCFHALTHLATPTHICRHTRTPHSTQYHSFPLPTHSTHFTFPLSWVPIPAPGPARWHTSPAAWRVPGRPTNSPGNARVHLPCRFALCHPYLADVPYRVTCCLLGRVLPHTLPTGIGFPTCCLPGLGLPQVT